MIGCAGCAPRALIRETQAPPAKRARAWSQDPADPPPASFSAEPRGHPFQSADVPLPAIVCALIVGLVFRLEANCSMRTRTPPFVGVNVQVTMVFSPPFASSPDAFQL